MYNFTYLTTNLINGKMYYGVHSTKNINDGYIGSGKALKLAIQKYGISNFKREVLEYFDTRELASNAEAELITADIVNSDIWYNLNPGGDNCSSGHSETTKLKISKALSGKNNPRYGCKWSEIDKDKLAGFKGRTHSEESKQLMSKSRTGLRHSEETKHKMSLAQTGLIKAKGHKHTDETKFKISEAKSGKNNYRFDPRKVKATNLATSEEIIFESKHSAAKTLNISSSNISKACDGVYKSCKGFEWHYI